MPSARQAICCCPQAWALLRPDSYLAATGEFVLVIQGVIFVVIVMAFRKGLVGELTDWWKSRRATADDGTPPSR